MQFILLVEIFFPVFHCAKSRLMVEAKAVDHS